MLDREKLQKEVKYRLLASPATLFPFLGGATGLGVACLLSLPAGFAFASVVVMVGAGTAAVTRILFGAEKVTNEVAAEFAQADKAKREAELDELERQLEADSRSNATQHLRDLRALVARCTQEELVQRWTPTGGLRILSDVETLFQGSIAALRETVRLRMAAEEVENRSVRGQLNARRRALMEEVEQSVQRLTDVVVGLETGGDENTSAGSELSRNRSRLDASLAAAREVEGRMRAMREELDIQ